MARIIPALTHGVYSYNSSYSPNNVGYGDLVNLIPKTSNWSNSAACTLPRAQDFEGKIIEIFAFAYGTEAKSVYVSSCVSGGLAYKVYYDGSKLNITRKSCQHNNHDIDHWPAIRFL